LVHHEASLIFIMSTSKPKAEVTLRKARFSELPAVARILSLAFWDDQIFGELIHPKRDQYPLDSDLYWLRDARVNYFNPHYEFLVATIPDTNSARGETIVGIAEWERLGNGPRARQRSRLDPSKQLVLTLSSSKNDKVFTVCLGNILKPLMTKAMAVHERLYPNHAISSEYGDIVERAYPFFDSVWSGDRAESWYLSFLAVHPDYQGIGAGKKLTLWGLDQAEQEGVVASVITALGTEEFYRRCGFDETFGCARDGEGNPIADKQGLYIMWKWPSGSKRVDA